MVRGSCQKGDLRRKISVTLSIISTKFSIRDFFSADCIHSESRDASLYSSRPFLGPRDNFCIECCFLLFTIISKSYDENTFAIQTCTAVDLQYFNTVGSAGDL
jgi:hypothetical protein